MAGDRPRILVFTYTLFAREPRALKQVDFLRQSYDVTTAGYGPAPREDVPHIEIPEIAPLRWGLLGRMLNLVLLVLHVYRPLTWISALHRESVRLLRHGGWDLVIAHDLLVFEAALDLKPRHGVVLDLHEYAPRQGEHSFVWRLLIAPYVRWMCRTRIPNAAAVVAVSQGIVDEYRRVYGFDSTLVVNATPYYDLPVCETGSPLRLVHSGGVSPQRRLDIMIQGVRRSTANVTLDLFLMGDNAAVMEELRSLAEGDDRIRFRDPVPYSKLVATLNTFDVGLSIFPPTTFNLAWCLPNKFFDFVQARLGVIVGPSPEMARFVDECGIGLVLPDFEPSSLAVALESVTPAQVDAWKAASAANAAALSSESQASIWEGLMTRLLPRDAAAN